MTIKYRRLSFCENNQPHFSFNYQIHSSKVGSNETIPKKTGFVTRINSPFFRVLSPLMFESECVFPTPRPSL